MNVQNNSSVPDPTIDENVYVTEEEFNILYNEIREKYGSYASEGPIPGITTLIENRQKSKQVEKASVEAYDTEEEAATAFAELAIPDTGKDHLEGGAVIIHTTVPVIDQGWQHHNGRKVHTSGYVCRRSR